MIREALTYLTTPCPALYRRMGFLTECVGIESRYRRNRAAWAPHLEASRNVILEAAETCPERDTALIFGAGLLYDIPLEALLARFDRVILADLLFMAPARKAARRQKGLDLLTMDVTGALERLAKGETDLSTPDAFLEDPAISLVVSVNVLSQLSIVPNEYLEKRFGQSEPESEALGRRLVEAHLAYLSAFGCPVALITDETRIVRDRAGTETGTVSALHDVPLPAGGSAWNWEICPLGEIDRQHSVTHRVRGYADFPTR